MLADFLAKKFIKDYQDTENPRVMDAYAKMANIVFMVFMGAMGIVKFFIGNATGSLAITSSSFADFSDIGLAVMMMLSVNLANKKPDAKHPFGYARIEYITGVVVSLVVVLLGVQLFMSSIDKIMKPAAPDASLAAYIIMAVSVAVNFIVFSVNRRISKQTRSVALKAAATKNVIDGIASAVVLLSLGFFSIFGVDLDGYVGLLMSLLILYSAVMSLKDTINPLLGLVPDLEFSKKMTERILQYPNILGVHDEIIHNYGNNRCYMTVHAEFSNELSAEEIHQSICDIENDFMFDGITLNIHFDLAQTTDAISKNILKQLEQICPQIAGNCKISDLKIMHADEITYLFFTLCLPRNNGMDAKELKSKIIAEISKIDSSYKAAISVRYSHI